MPFKLESFSAPRTRVVHVHHHHYSDGVHDSSEDEYDEDEYDDYEYEEDNYEKDKYEADDYEEDEYDEYEYEEFEFSENTSESEFSGEIGSDSLFTTSCDDDSSFSGYEESSY